MPSTPPRPASRRQRRPGARRAAVAAAVAALVPALLVGGAGAQELPRIQAGEQLTYQVRVGKFGTIGRGAMTAGGPVDVRGTPAWALRFEFSTKVGFVRVVNRSESWVAVGTGAALRFHKHEKHPLSTHTETIELYPAERRWEAADGTSGESTTPLPLDELSYLYLLRALPLEPGDEYEFERHFDTARNPTTVRVLGRDTVTTPAGTFPAILVEMRVKDARRYKGEGVLRLHLTDDADRVPVRMESSMPVVGSAVLVLEARTRIPTTVAAGAP